MIYISNSWQKHRIRNESTVRSKEEWSTHNFHTIKFLSATHTSVHTLIKRMWEKDELNIMKFMPALDSHFYHQLSSQLYGLSLSHFHLQQFLPPPIQLFQLMRTHEDGQEQRSKLIHINDKDWKWNSSALKDALYLVVPNFHVIHLFRQPINTNTMTSRFS